MSTSIRMDSTDLTILAVALNAAPGRIVAAAQTVIAKVTTDVEADARILCPVDTGNLRNSVYSEVGNLSGVVGATADYALFVEGGTSVNAPQPFLSPALDRHLDKVPAALSAIATVGLV